MQDFWNYFTDLRRDAGPRLPIAALFVALGAVLEGIGILAILPFAAMITGNAETPAAQTILSWMDAVGASDQLSRALVLAAAFLSLLAIRAVVIWQRDTRLIMLGFGYVDRWRSRLFTAIGRADWPTVNSLRRTDIEHALTNDVGRLNSGTDLLLKSGAALAMVVVQLGLIALLSPGLLVLVFVLLGVSLGLTLPLMRRANLLGGRMTRSGRRTHGVLGDFLVSQKLARLNNAEDEFSTQFDTAIGDVRSHQFAFRRMQITARLAFQFAAGIVVMAALLIGFFYLETPLSVLAVTLVVLARLVAPVQALAGTGQAIANALPAFRALTGLRDDLEAAAVHRTEIGTLTPSSAEPVQLTLQDVSFAHVGNGGPLLQSVSLDIAPSEVVALRGRSGSGKTTLLDVMSGLLKPTQGTLSIDGEVIADEDAMRAWRSQLAYLPQDPFLFDATIRENLIWAAAQGDDEAIWNALELAGAAEFIHARGAGLDSRAGDRGIALSGGERQRLCIARALLRQPRFLILDEATSALDAKLEEDILARLIGMRDRFSILFVTHRGEALKHADRVLTLENRQITST